MSQLSDGPPLLVAPARPSSGWPFRQRALLVGLGCLGAPVMGCLLIGALLVVAMAAVRSSDAYQQAVSVAQHHPSVIAALGAPVEPGWLTSGRVDVYGAGGDATLAIPISGPRASGTLNVRAEKSAGRWTFHRMSVDIPGRPAPVDLLAPASGP